MTVKNDTHEVVSFAFVPVSSLPDRRDRIDSWIFFRDSHFQANPVSVRSGYKVVDYFESGTSVTGIPRIIDSCKISKVVHFERRFIAKEKAGVFDLVFL